MKLEKRRFLIPVILLGPLLALFVTWQPAIDITRVDVPTAVSDQVVQYLRVTPPDVLLRELADTGVSYPSYDDMPDAEVLSIADALLSSTYEIDDGYEPIGVPFEPGLYLFGQSGWHLDFHSFAVPSVLARAYEISREIKYLESAVDFVVDFAEYESSLWLPLGYIFNDHAIAARSIVVTEVWRQYRKSSIFDADIALAYLRYVQKLMALLMEDRLYEYRTNHGIMQNLSLLHLGVAFPNLPSAEQAFAVGMQRLNMQLEYYVNEEGVILEHSAGYQMGGVMRLSAAWRYFGLAGTAVSPEMIERYRKALAFSGALRHPDGTLPHIGDTGDHRHVGYLIADFDGENTASSPLRTEDDSDFVPEAVIMAPAAGYAVVWDGLPFGPDDRNLVQTVFHWSNFPSGVHKHADDLGVALWAGGTQWIRAVGSWPYIPSRQAAIGWRSSNGPHWLGESPDTARENALDSYAVAADAFFFDVVRHDEQGRGVRRQLVKPDRRTWVVVDSFSAKSPGSKETVWRFSPDLSLETVSARHFRVIGEVETLAVRMSGAGDIDVQADPPGEAGWNSGLIADGEIVPSPALRVLAGSDRPATATVFQLEETLNSPPAGAIRFEWKSERAWALQIIDSGEGAISLRRTGDSLMLDRAGAETRELRLLEGMPRSAVAARNKALNAYRAATVKYGEPFQLMLARRIKVSIAVVAVALGQFAMFVFVRRRFPALWRPLTAASVMAWLALSFYIGVFFLGG